jgi:hypothetical protein
MVTENARRVACSVLARKVEESYLTESGRSGWRAACCAAMPWSFIGSRPRRTWREPSDSLIDHADGGRMRLH